MGSQNLICFFVSQNFHHAIGVGNSFSPGVGEEGENTLVILDAYVMEFLPCFFRSYYVKPTVATSGYV